MRQLLLVLQGGIDPPFLHYQCSVLPLYYKSIGTQGRTRTDTILLLRETPHTNWATWAFGVGSRIRTDGFADLQSVAMGRSATPT